VGASAYLRRVSSRTVEMLLADPSRVKSVLFPSSSETMIDDEVLIALEGWEALGQDFIRDGGTPIGDVVVGDGPARAFTSAEVRRIAGKLALVAPDSIADAARPEFDSMRELVMTTAQAEAALIIYLG
jgi:hypothetical protein